jgi:GT2 family glycosyltransferase
MQTMPNVAVVYGPWINLPKTSQQDNKSCIEFARFEENDYSLDGQKIGGAALYRRSVLIQVGTFNPYLYSDEEPELSLRIRHAGYNILCLRHPIAYHYSDPSEAISTLFKRWRRNLWLGSGQSMRYHLNDELFWTYVKERGFGCLPALVLATGMMCILFTIILNHWSFFVLWLLLLILILIGMAFRKQSLYRVVYSVIQRLLVLDGTIRGFLIRPMKPDTYPCNIEVFKQKRDDTEEYK